MQPRDYPQVSALSNRKPQGFASKVTPSSGCQLKEELRRNINKAFAYVKWKRIRWILSHTVPAKEKVSLDIFLKY